MMPGWRRDDDVPSSVLVRFVRMMDWLVVAGGDRCFVMVVSGSFDFLHLGVETVFVVGGVGDHPGGTVGFQETVRAFDVSVSVVGLVMALDVVGVRVVHGVIEVVRCGCVGVVAVVVVVRLETVVLDNRRWVGKCQLPEQGGEHDQLQCLAKVFGFGIGRASC